MIDRRIFPEIEQRLDEVPAVALLGPRQVGKTTLALVVAEKRDAVYLDLESQSDLSKLADPELYLSAHSGRLVILDEVQRQPGLFQSLRGLIDKGRRGGGGRAGNGRFLLLGSASMDLMRQSGESLAGRISYLELAPLDVTETAPEHHDKLWLRGGFPESFGGRTIPASMRWRRDFITTYLERDIPLLGPRIPAETLRRFWTMLANRQGQLHNAATIAASLAVDGKTVARYLDLFVDLLLVRRLQPWHRNAGKRLVKSPKIFIRDSGLVHCLLRIQDREELLGNPIAGASWEGWIIENLINIAPEGTEAFFYRTSAGAEIDLVLSLPGGEVWALEIKRGLAPKVARGFYTACDDIRATNRFVVYSGSERYPLAEGIEAIGVEEIAALLAKAR